MRKARYNNSTSSPKKPKTGQAPINRKATPEQKLTPPNTIISTRKPTLPSERCGVIVVEKMVGSGLSAVMLSEAMALSIPEFMAKKTQSRSKPKRKPTARRAKVKGPRQRAKADVKAAQGALRLMSNAEID